MADAGSKRNEPRKLISFTRFDRLEPVALSPIIAGILFPGTLNAIVGRSGCCKTFVGGSMGLSIATGTQFMGRDVEPGAVFYIGGEGLGGIRKRFQGWANFHGVSLVGAPIFISDGLPPLHDIVNVAEVIEEIRKIVEDLLETAGGLEPRAVFIDTFARGMAGADENSASDVGRLVQGLDWIASTWPCAVVVIHHTGHGEATKERGRGSSAFYAALDGELLVQSDGGPVTIRCTKAKDWVPDQGMTLDRHIVEVDSGGVIETTLVLAPAQGRSLNQREQDVRREIRRLRDEGLAIRAIAAEVGVTKSKVEHVLATVARETTRYEEASDGR